MSFILKEINCQRRWRNDDDNDESSSSDENEDSLEDENGAEDSHSSELLYKQRMEQDIRQEKCLK